jgi:chromosome segregation ATPase
MSLKWAGYPYSIEKLRKLADSVVDDAGRSKEYIAQYLAKAWEEQQRLDKEIEELKEENKKITKLKNRAVKHIMKLNKEIKELKDEKEEETSEETNVCNDCNKDISFCRTIDSKDYCLKCAVKHEKNIQEETSEEEVDKLNCCCECNTKKDCLSDTFVTIRELDGTDSVMCGMCSLNHFQ